MSVSFEDYSVKVKQVIDDKAIQFLNDAGREISAQTSKNIETGKGTGQLKGSWVWKVNKKDLYVKIGSCLEHAIWYENGTGEFALNGDGRKGNWYVPIGSGKDEMPSEVAEKYGFKIIESKDGKKFAEVHGQKPKRPLHKAFKSTKSKLVNRVKTIFGG